MEYPRRKNGDEYYPKNLKQYLKNENGDEVYARNRRGSESYPERGPLTGKPAVDRNGRVRYAHDSSGNEIYPRNNRLSFVIHEDDKPVLASNRFGLQKYPTDYRGNEYYPLKSEAPLIIFDSNNRPVFARSKEKNLEMIPQSFFRSHSAGENFDCFRPTRDAAGNVVYVMRDKSNNDRPGFWKCSVDLSWLVPSILGIVVMCLFWP